MAGAVIPSLSTGETARKLQMSESFIRKKCEKGEIPFTKTSGGHYRIPEWWVEQEIERRNSDLTKGLVSK